MVSAARKRELVEQALASATRVRPKLDVEDRLVTPMVAPVDACLAAVRTWLEHGDRVVGEVAEAVRRARAAIERACEDEYETPGPAHAHVRFDRAMRAAFAAVEAGDAAAWTAADAMRGWEHDPAEAQARADAGPELEAHSAEQNARLAERA